MRARARLVVVPETVRVINNRALCLHWTTADREVSATVAPVNMGSSAATIRGLAPATNGVSAKCFEERRAAGTPQRVEETAQIDPPPELAHDSAGAGDEMSGPNESAHDGRLLSTSRATPVCRKMPLWWGRYSAGLQFPLAAASPEPAPGHSAPDPRDAVRPVCHALDTHRCDAGWPNQESSHQPPGPHSPDS